MRSPVGLPRRSRDSARKYPENSTLAADGDRGVVLGRMQLVHAADVGRPRPQQVPICAWHAEQLRDHRHGEGFRDRRQQVELGADGDVVHQVVGELLHGIAHRLDHARRECLRHEPAHPGVVRRLHVEDAVIDQVPECVS